MMKRESIAKFFGEEWVDFMTPFCQSEEWSKITGELKKQKEEGKTIIPDQKLLFRPFQLVPFSQLRIVILGAEPMPKLEYANGLAYGHNAGLKPAPSMQKIVDAVEVDCYNGLNFDKDKFDVTLESWAKQGILLLNTALTIALHTPEGADKPERLSHKELWEPFTKYVIDTINKTRRDRIFLAWGKDQLAFTEKVDFYNHFTFSAEHPNFAAQEKRPWRCNHFSLVNAIITGNRLGDKIVW